MLNDLQIQEVEIAKDMIRNGDYVAARKRLLEVQRHAPAFDDISGMIAVCDILNSSSYKFLGCGNDYYWILEVSPAASELVIQNQYFKFIKLLKPIKDNFPGAASALEILQDAFSVLSDPEKRSLFDGNRAKGLRCYGYGKVVEASLIDPQQGGFLTTKRKPPDGCDLTHRTASVFSNVQEMDFDDAEPYNIAVARHIGNTPIDLDESDVHGHRHVEISANAREAIIKKNNSLASDELDEELAIKNYFRNHYNFNDMRKAEVFAVGQMWAIYDEECQPRKYAQIVNIRISQSPSQIYVNWLIPVPVTIQENKCIQAGLPFVCGLFGVDRKQTDMIEHTSFSHLVFPHISRDIEIYARTGEIWAIYEDCELEAWCSHPSARKQCKLKLVEVVQGFHGDNIDILVFSLEKVEGFKTVYRRCMDNGSACSFLISTKDVFVFSHVVPAHKLVSSVVNISDEIFQLDPLAVSKIGECFPTEERSCNSSCVLNNDIITSNRQIEQVTAKRSAEDFVSGQVWAVYDDLDAMPRQYVIVNSVVSETEVSVTLLEPQPLFPVNKSLVKTKFPSGCGLFRVGKTILHLRPSEFSHIVECEQCQDDHSYRIFPKKGETWAMYDKWCSESKNTDLIKYRYKIVEIVTDFFEQTGLIVVNLEKARDCSTLFRRQVIDGFELVRAVPAIETASFSHKVAFAVQDNNALNISENCWLLEPDASPDSLVYNSN